MKRLTLILALGLAACATDGGAPAQYAQGVPVAPIRTMPRAWDSPATRDAPHTQGMPGHAPGVRVAPQPQPKPTRYLPETPETRKQPGIWAAQESDVEPLGVLLGMTLPYPPNASTDAEKEATNMCASAMGREVRKAIGEAELRKLRPSLTACLAARLYAYCVDLLLENDFAMIREMVAYSRDWTRSLRESFGPAVLLVDAMCSKLPPSDKTLVDDFVRRTNNQFLKTMKEHK